MSLTFATCYGAQLDVELSSEDTAQLFTTVRRKKAVNDGQDAFVRLTDCIIRYGSIAIVDETQEYDLENITDYIRLSGPPSIKIVKAGATDRYLQGEGLSRRTAEELDVEVPGWRATTSGTPINWYLKEDGGTTNVGFYPKPNVGTGETWTILVPYVAQAAAMSDDAVIPFTVGTAPILRLYPYHQAIVHYAAAVLEPLRKNYSGAQRQMQLFNGFVAQYFQARRREGPDQIRLARNYYRDASPAPRPHDWRTWP